MGGLIKQITGNNDMKGKKNLGKEKWTSRIRQKSENIKGKISGSDIVKVNQTKNKNEEMEKKNCKTLAEETCKSWKEKCADQT